MWSPNTTKEEQNEIIRLSIKHVVGLFPVAGPILNDIFFAYRNNVKQERLNHFISLLEDAFIAHSIHIDQLKTEEGLDLLESIVRKAADSRSQRKRVAFKNILMEALITPEKIDDCEIYVDLLSNLKDHHIKILLEHEKYLFDGMPLRQKFRELDQLYKTAPAGATYIYKNEELKNKSTVLNQKITEAKDLMESTKRIAMLLFSDWSLVNTTISFAT